MTPTLLALSRAYLALPGAPVRDMIADELAVNGTPDGYPRFRDRAGLLWCPDFGADRPAPWVLDLTDASTGGVLWDRFRAVVHRFIAAGSDGYVLREMYGEDGDTAVTLAEAVARAAVALGRAS